MKLPPLLYEDDYVFVFNKPAGLMVHPDGRPAQAGKSREATLADMLLTTYPKLAGVGEPMLIDGEKVIRPGIIHRLDTDTTGALIVAKTQESFDCLKAQFLAHEVAKVYNAFIYGHPRKEFGTITEAIGRSAKDFRMYSAQRGAKGEKREAITLYRVLDRFVDETQPDEWKRYSFMELRPKTGRTHQLRVHMKYMHHPIVSDSLYAKGYPKALGFERLALHAKSIAFSTPDGKEHVVEAPYPKDFEKALQSFVSHAKV